MPSIQIDSLEAHRMASGLDDCQHPIVVMLGATGVGKTAIVQRLFWKPFPVKHAPTVEEMHSVNYKLSGSTLRLKVLDTSGMDEFPAMRKLAIQKGSAFVLVYAIDKPESFETVAELRQLIHEVRGDPEVPIVVVGNKCDLEESRQVSKDITESVVTMDWENGFVEASAKENVNIMLIFMTVLRHANINYALGEAEEKRRKSLPAHPTTRKLKDELEPKRHSCTIQ